LHLEIYSHSFLAFIKLVQFLRASMPKKTSSSASPDSQPRYLPSPPRSYYSLASSPFEVEESGPVSLRTQKSSALRSSNLRLDREDKSSLVVALKDDVSAIEARYGAQRATFSTRTLKSSRVAVGYNVDNTIENRQGQEQSSLRNSVVLEDNMTQNDRFMMKEEAIQALTTIPDVHKVRTWKQRARRAATAPSSSLRIDTEIRNLMWSSLTENQTTDVNNGKLGHVYVFKNMNLDDNLWKIGFTNTTPKKRMKSLESACGAIFQNHYQRSELPAAARVERFCHVTLQPFNRPYRCARCKNGRSAVQHREFYELRLDIIQSYVDLWSDFMIQNPYDRAGNLEQFWAARLESVPLPTGNENHEDHENILQRWEAFVHAPQGVRKAWELSINTMESNLTNSSRPFATSQSEVYTLRDPPRRRTRLMSSPSTIRQILKPPTDEGGDRDDVQQQYRTPQLPKYNPRDSVNNNRSVEISRSSFIPQQIISPPSLTSPPSPRASLPDLHTQEHRNAIQMRQFSRNRQFTPPSTDEDEDDHERHRKNHISTPQLSRHIPRDLTSKKLVSLKGKARCSSVAQQVAPPFPSESASLFHSFSELSNYHDRSPRESRPPRGIQQAAPPATDKNDLDYRSRGQICVSPIIKHRAQESTVTFSYVPIIAKSTVQFENEVLSYIRLLAAEIESQQKARFGCLPLKHKRQSKVTIPVII
jgi:T5orf172 domain